MDSQNQHTSNFSTSFQDCNGTSGNLNGTVQNIDAIKFDGVDIFFLESDISPVGLDFDSSNTGFDVGHGDNKGNGL